MADTRLAAEEGTRIRARGGRGKSFGEIAKQRRRASETGEEKEDFAEEAGEPGTSDWLVGCGTVLLHTYSPGRRAAAVVAFIYRRLPLSGASAAF